MLTSADILRRLAEAVGPATTPGTRPDCVLAALRALAREPGGAEAVAEAVGVHAVIETQRMNSPAPAASAAVTCGGTIHRARIVAGAKEPTP